MNDREDCQLRCDAANTYLREPPAKLTVEWVQTVSLLISYVKASSYRNSIYFAAAMRKRLNKIVLEQIANETCVDSRGCAKAAL